MSPTYLSLEDLLLLTKRLGAGPVRDPGLLASAAARPGSAVYGEDVYATSAEKAAALLHSICRSHALVDGNKRLAWAAAVTFLVLNDSWVEMLDDDAFDLVMSVAEGALDVPAIAARLAPSLIPLSDQ